MPIASFNIRFARLNRLLTSPVLSFVYATVLTLGIGLRFLAYLINLGWVGTAGGNFLLLLAFLVLFICFIRMFRVMMKPYRKPILVIYDWGFDYGFDQRIDRCGGIQWHEVAQITEQLYPPQRVPYLLVALYDPGRLKAAGKLFDPRPYKYQMRSDKGVLIDMRAFDPAVRQQIAQLMYQCLNVSRANALTYNVPQQQAFPSEYSPV